VKRDEVRTRRRQAPPGLVRTVLLSALPPGCSAACTSYASAPDITTSDHKPVSATFDLPDVRPPGAHVPRGSFQAQAGGGRGATCGGISG